jgi:hypothetical protein
MPPFGDFRQVPHGMWLRNNLVLLQVRRRALLEHVHV